MRPDSTRLAVIMGALTLSACVGVSVPRAAPIPLPVPGVAAESALLVRGTDEGAGALSNDDQTEIVSRVLQEFYYPPDRQARWLDPRPLANRRGAAADDTVGADPDFADEAVRATGTSRICVLGYRDFGCRGKTGGIVRFSWPYRVSKDTAVVFAIYTPRDSLGVASAPQGEMQFKMKWSKSDESWAMFAKAPVTPKAKPAAPTP